MDLLGDDALDRSSVVANCRMNRERTLTGSNGYDTELGFHPLDLLAAKDDTKARWLDLCCGSGRALIEAARIVQARDGPARIEIVGVDLVAPRVPWPEDVECLQYVCASLADWQPGEPFDLITCVHGLHYIGDKLGLITRAASWLTADGLLVANLDLNNVKFGDRRPANRIVAAELRRVGLEYDRRRRRLRCQGCRRFELPFHYLGADDQAGPNYTKQAAVDSYYDRPRDPGCK